VISDIERGKQFVFRLKLFIVGQTLNEAGLACVRVPKHTYERYVFGHPTGAVECTRFGHEFNLFFQLAFGRLVQVMVLEFGPYVGYFSESDLELGYFASSVSLENLENDSVSIRDLDGWVVAQHGSSQVLDL
jgi:hypothetical protein